MELLDTLAEFAQSCGSRRFDKEVMHHAKRAVIDWYAALMPGAVVAPATLLEKALAEDLDRGGAHLALGRRATMRTAALINGTAAHAVEFDDIFKFGIYHPGAPTISAALAAAHHQNATGEAFLRAVIAGYEISTRIGAAMGRAHYKYWHNTGSRSVIGIAARSTDACNGHGHDILGRITTSLSHGFDVKAAPCRSRGRSGCAGSPRSP